VVVLASAAEDYGADRMLRRSVAELVADHRVTVVLPVDGPLRSRLEAGGAAVVVLADYALRRTYLSPRRASGLLWRNLTALAHLVRLHRRQAVDLVVTNTAAVVAGGAFARIVRRPHVWHVHEILDDPPAFARAQAWFIQATSDRVIACSHAARDQLVALRPSLADRIAVVLNGLPMPDRVVASEQDGVVRIGCVGRLHPRKGQRELVDAWVLAARRSTDGPRLELHLFGDALDGQEELVAGLHERISLAGLGDRAVFHGFVADPDAVYADLDVVVVPSVQPESFSLVCAEAAAYGLPVVAPDHDGPTEIVVPGETGLLVDPTDTEALADALTGLAEDASRRRALGAAGRRRAEANFSLRAYQDGVRRVVTGALPRVPAEATR
jgi:glycosyltransferase involved in cell wall biosynthesis